MDLVYTLFVGSFYTVDLSQSRVGSFVYAHASDWFFSFLSHMLLLVVFLYSVPIICSYILSIRDSRPRNSPSANQIIAVLKSYLISRNHFSSFAVGFSGCVFFVVFTMHMQRSPNFHHARGTGRAQTSPQYVRMWYRRGSYQAPQLDPEQLLQLQRQAGLQLHPHKKPRARAKRTEDAEDQLQFDRNVRRLIDMGAGRPAESIEESGLTPATKAGAKPPPRKQAKPHRNPRSPKNPQHENERSPTEICVNPNIPTTKTSVAPQKAA